jgi:hypothetical protein
MSKMRIFKFWNDDQSIEEETEQTSLKKAVKSIQEKFKKFNFVNVEYITKKGKELSVRLHIPFGRKKKLSR